jgi:hypothetical protein
MRLRPYWIFTIVILGSFQLKAQVSSVDSLESLVRSLPSDTNKVWMLNNLVSTLREKDNSLALAKKTIALHCHTLLKQRISRNSSTIAMALQQAWNTWPGCFTGAVIIRSHFICQRRL